MARIKSVDPELLAAFVIQSGGKNAAARFLGMNRATFFRALEGKGKLGPENVKKVVDAFEDAPAALKGRLADLRRMVIDRRVVGRESIDKYAQRLSKAGRATLQSELDASKELRRRAKMGIPPAQELPGAEQLRPPRYPFKGIEAMQEFLDVDTFEPRNRAELAEDRKQVQEEGMSALIALPGRQTRIEAYVDGERVGTFPSYEAAYDAVVEGLHGDRESAEEEDIEELPF